MSEAMKKIEKEFPETTGLYLKNLRTGKDFSYKADDFWYIASGVKIPVALEVLRQIDAGKLKWETKIEVQDSDYIDGAGELNYIKPQSKVSVRLLLDQSLTFSDNTATDMLIRTVTLEKVNALTQSLAPKSFKPITTLAEVRRQVYGQFHPDAKKLSNMEYIRLRVIKSEEDRMKKLAELLKINPDQMKHQNLDAAYEAYYSGGLNSATLRGAGLIFEKLLTSKLFKAESKKRLMKILEGSQTGKDRITRGLPQSYIFAAKTGTQHRRYCDMGILQNGSPLSPRIVVVACIKNADIEQAQKIFKKLGEAINSSDIFVGHLQ